MDRKSFITLAPEQITFQALHFTVGSDLSYKHYTRLEWHAKDQHSGLFFPFVSYEEKGFVSFATDEFRTCISFC
jgi:hypothetical protein